MKRIVERCHITYAVRFVQPRCIHVIIYVKGLRCVCSRSRIQVVTFVDIGPGCGLRDRTASARKKVIVLTRSIVQTFLYSRRTCEMDFKC